MYYALDIGNSIAKLLINILLNVAAKKWKWHAILLIY